MMLETMKLKALPLVQGNFSSACMYSRCLRWLLNKLERTFRS